MVLAGADDHERGLERLRLGQQCRHHISTGLHDGGMELAPDDPGLDGPPWIPGTHPFHEALAGEFRLDSVVLRPRR